jgi:Zn-dependent protease with chaperone function
MSRFAATYFDGAVAADRPVHFDTDATGLIFSGTGVQLQTWRYADLTAVDPPSAGVPLRLANLYHPGARLVIAAEEAKADVLHRAPHLKGGVAMARVIRTLSWIAAGLAALLALLYVVVQFMPQRIAFLLPDSWRDRVGAQIETSLVEGARRCATPEAAPALSAMVARLAEGNPDLPPVAVHVYDIPVMNAFAMPGGRIVVTGELIKRAEAPDEVAGVLAHELGHVVNRHSEAQIIRATGLQLVFAIVTGGSGTDTVSQLAGLAAILRYSRHAEAEADDYAIALLTAAAIDPQGLKHFFERVLAEEGKTPSGTFGKIESVFATHPGTAERIGKIGPLPEGVAARPVMSAAQWQALKAICGS